MRLIAANFYKCIHQPRQKITAVKKCQPGLSVYFCVNRNEAVCKAGGRNYPLSLTAILLALHRHGAFIRTVVFVFDFCCIKTMFLIDALFAFANYFLLDCFYLL
jgi:hypothetical protein